LAQSRGQLRVDPVTVKVHVASVWVPFTSESKEAIASDPEIVKELRLRSGRGRDLRLTSIGVSACVRKVNVVRFSYAILVRWQGLAFADVSELQGIVDMLQVHILAYGARHGLIFRREVGGFAGLVQKFVTPSHQLAKFSELRNQSWS